MAFSAAVMAGAAAVGTAASIHNASEARKDAKNALKEREVAASRAAQSALMSRRARSGNSLFTGAGESASTPTAAGGRTTLGV